MKRWLAIILAVLLCLSCTVLAEESKEAPSGIDETISHPKPVPLSPKSPDKPSNPNDDTGSRVSIAEGAGESFADSLTEWTAALDPSAHDLQARVTAGTEVYSAAVRQDGQLTEIEIPGIGILQFDQEQVVLNVAGQTYTLAAKSFQDVISNAQINALRTAADVELVGRLLAQFAEEVLAPHVKITNAYGTTNLHIDLSGRQLWDSTIAFLDKTIEGDYFAMLYPRYIRFVQMLDPYAPATVDAFREMWPRIKSRRYSRLMEYALEADVQLYLQSWSSPEIACAVQFTHRDGQINFGFDYVSSYDGFSLSASVNGFDRYKASSFDIAASLAGHGSHLFGDLLINAGESISYALDMNFTDTGLNAHLDCRKGNELQWTVTAEGNDNLEDGVIRGRVDYTEGEGDDATTTTLAALEAQYWNGSCSGMLTLPGTNARFRVVTGDSYMHVTIKTQAQASFEPDNTWDLWLFRLGWSDYRAHCEILQDMHGRRFRHTLLTGEIRPNGVSFSVTDPLRSVATSGSLYFEERPDGYDFKVEYLGDAARYLAFHGVEKTPFSLHLSRTGETFSLSLSDTLAQYNRSVKLDTGFKLNEDGQIVRIDGTYESKVAQRKADPPQVVQFSGVPGKLTVTHGDEVYTLEDVSASPREIRWQLTSNTGMPVYTAIIELDEALTALTARLTAGDYDIASLCISSEDKTPITPLETKDAIQVTPDNLMDLINAAVYQMQSSGTSTEEAPATVEITPTE